MTMFLGRVCLRRYSIFKVSCPRRTLRETSRSVISMGLRCNSRGRSAWIKFVMQHSDAALAGSLIGRSQQETQVKLNRPRLVHDRTWHPPWTGIETAWRRRALLAIGTIALLSLAACSTPMGAPNLQGKPLSGYVEMSQVQAAYIGSGSAGHGTLRLRGNTYPFNVGGLGVGGIGISKIEARGDVYGLRRLGDFPGAYAQGRYGFALGTTSAGDLWLQNEHGVIMRLNAKRKGLMLSLGGDAVVISMNQ